jgi:hypothetical protein
MPVALEKEDVGIVVAALALLKRVRWRPVDRVGACGYSQFRTAR